MKDYKILDQLACYHGTDKSSKGHHYTKYYAQHLPDQCGKLLEIGAYKGASLRLWRDIFGCEIHTIDLFKEFSGKYLEILTKEGFICHQGDQTNYKFLSTIKNQFDVVIEDGSHNCKDQLISFVYHFQHSVKSGGLYVVEDLHACTEDFYRDGMPYGETLLSWIKSLIAGEHPENPWVSGDILEFIAGIHLYEDKIAFIQKC